MKKLGLLLAAAAVAGLGLSGPTGAATPVYPT